MAAPLAGRIESWIRDQAARLQPWAAALPQAPRWPWPPPRPAWPWPGDRKRQRERMFREEFERRRRQLRELCRAVHVDTVAELQELLCAMVLAECVYKRPVSEMMRYINKFKSDFGGNIVSLERVQPSLDHVPHRPCDHLQLLLHLSSRKDTQRGSLFCNYCEDKASYATGCPKMCDLCWKAL